MQRAAIVLGLAICALAASTGTTGVRAGEDCVDPTPGAGGEIVFQGLGTPNHAGSAHGDVCPGETETWTFRTIDVPVDQYTGVLLSETTGAVSMTVTPQYGDPIAVEHGTPGRFGPVQTEFVYTVRITGGGSGISTYTLLVCRSITNPCPFVAGFPHIGDANCDNTVNALDARAVFLYVAGIVQSLTCAVQADANQDGRVTAVDGAVILQAVAGLIPPLPDLPPSG